MPAVTTTKKIGVIEKKPKGWEWSRCTTPRCRRKASVVVNGRGGRTFRCQDHLAHCGVIQRATVGRGKGIAKHEVNAYGGYYGWEYRIIGEEIQV